MTVMPQTEILVACCGPTVVGWDPSSAPTPKRCFELQHKGNARAFCWLNAKALATAGDECVVNIFGVRDSKRIASVPTPSKLPPNCAPATSMTVFSRDSVVCGHEDGSLIWYRLMTQVRRALRLPMSNRRMRAAYNIAVKGFGRRQSDHARACRSALPCMISLWLQSAGMLCTNADPDQCAGTVSASVTQGARAYSCRRCLHSVEAHRRCQVRHNPRLRMPRPLGELRHDARPGRRPAMAFSV